MRFLEPLSIKICLRVIQGTARIFLTKHTVSALGPYHCIKRPARSSNVFVGPILVNNLNVLAHRNSAYADGCRDRSVCRAVRSCLRKAAGDLQRFSAFTAVLRGISTETAASHCSASASRSLSVAISTYSANRRSVRQRECHKTGIRLKWLIRACALAIGSCTGAQSPGSRERLAGGRQGMPPVSSMDAAKSCTDARHDKTSGRQDGDRTF